MREQHENMPVDILAIILVKIGLFAKRGAKFFKTLFASHFKTIVNAEGLSTRVCIGESAATCVCTECDYVYIKG